MKAIVSVFAKDSKGITAYVASLFAEKEINILDISQTLMQEFFAMIMLVNLADCATPLMSCRIFFRRRARSVCLTYTSSVRIYLRPCTGSDAAEADIWSYIVNSSEILQTIEMINQQHLDVRTVTMGISLLDCADSDMKSCCDKVYEKDMPPRKLVETGCAIEREFGIPIVNKRVSVTPISLVAASCRAEDPFRWR